MVLAEVPTKDRELEVKLSGMSSSLVVYLNDAPVGAEYLPRSKLAVPADGTYEIKVLDAGVVRDVATFTVISRSL